MECWYKKETNVFIRMFPQLGHMEQKDNGYVRIPVTNEVFDILSQKKRKAAVKAGKDITWDEFLLEETKK
jgi:hypothetical protein